MINYGEHNSQVAHKSKLNLIKLIRLILITLPQEQLIRVTWEILRINSPDKIRW